MDFTMLFSKTNIYLIMAIVVLLELAKRLIERAIKRESPDWIWKIAVIVAGVGAAFIATSYANYKQFVAAAVIYAAVSTIVYQTGKLAISTILKANE